MASHPHGISMDLFIAIEFTHNDWLLQQSNI